MPDDITADWPAINFQDPLGLPADIDEVIAEGRGYGLDIAEERCDIGHLYDTVTTIRACPREQRAEAVALANDGYPIWYEFPR
jgi:hypothetical protein